MLFYEKEADMITNKEGKFHERIWAVGAGFVTGAMLTMIISTWTETSGGYRIVRLVPLSLICIASYRSILSAGSKKVC